MALQAPFVGFEVDRPRGYPFLVWLFTLDNRSLILLTGVQHLVGLATAVMVYMIGLRLRLGRWVAALVALATSDMNLRYFVPCVRFVALGGARALATVAPSLRRVVTMSPRGLPR
jgi:hypothetical protein